MLSTLTSKSETKTCTKCNKEKSLGEFRSYTRKGITKLEGRCKLCALLHIAAWRKANPDKIKIFSKTYRINHLSEVSKRSMDWSKLNKERVNANKRKWHAENLEIGRGYCKAYRSKNPGSSTYHSSKRRIRKLQSQPIWADENKIKEIYKLAQTKNRESSDSWHVDHIIPLVHPLVCGLHCEFNLQIISAKENLSKHNKFKII